MHPNIGLLDEQREGAVAILNTLLADEYLLYTKTRNYHWNVVGPQFNDLHKFFEAQYNELNEIIDEVAERSRALGGNAFGTMIEFLKSTRLKEESGYYPEASHMTLICWPIMRHSSAICGSTSKPVPSSITMPAPMTS
jgi:starvation-inducible DNA-binding protein